MASNHRADISTSCYKNSGKTSDFDIYDEKMRQRIVGIKTRAEKDSKKMGFTCSAFDLLHPGHVIMLQDSKDQCDFLVVGVHVDPTFDRPDSKNKPVQTFEERKIMISSCRYVDFVVEYATENDLYNILSDLQPHVRILGSDWEGKKYTGHELENIAIYWHDRSNHSFSTTNLRKRIYQAEMDRMG